MRPPSQFKKFTDIFTKLINDVNSDQGNSIEIIDEIKKELKNELPRLCGQNFREAIQEPRQNLENP